MDETHCTVDAGTEFALWGLCDRTQRAYPELRPLVSDRTWQMPPWARRPAVSSIPVRMACTAPNRSKRAVFCVAWTPDGRRMLTGTMGGEFNLFHGTNFGLEMVMQAHESAVRCLSYAPSGDWLISGDQDGLLKVWQPNFNNVKMMRAHTEVLRDVCWSPSGTKFATCSDDGSVKIWSFATMANEHAFAGRNAHGWDVKCVDWHPSLGLLASGSKDNTMRLWDPRAGKLLTTVHSFKNTVTKTKFQPTGAQNLLAAACRDNTAHVFDVRMLGYEIAQVELAANGAGGAASGAAGAGAGAGAGASASSIKPIPDNTASTGTDSPTLPPASAVTGDTLHTAQNATAASTTPHIEQSSTLAVLRGHPADVSCLEWHPYHPQLLATGTHQGSLHYFLLDDPSLRNDVGHLLPAWSVEHAHQWPVWDLAWHPAGHMLASGSNDKTVKIWKRAEVGDSRRKLEAQGAEENQPPVSAKKRARRPPGLA